MRIPAAAIPALLIVSIPAVAALGQSEESVAADTQHFAARLHTAVLRDYKVHEITREDGTQIREFVSHAGTVFGVAWQAPAMPNLPQLLGPYFSQFQAAGRSPRSRRGPLTVRIGDLVVESGGHMRSFHGRAYLTSLLPVNIPQDVVQ
jgi:hypothetical protein